MSWLDDAQVKTAEDLAQEAHRALLQRIAAKRYAKETGGITVDGLSLATDRQSQALITGAALSAMRDETYSLRWKTSSGFVNLDGQTILAAADAVRDHVQACFDREAALIEAVESGSFTEAMLDEGWPV